MPPIDEILVARPTVDEEASFHIVYEGLARVGKRQWVSYDSSLDERTKELAQRFVDEHSYVELGSFGFFRSPRPGVVIRYPGKDGGFTSGALYSNGLVLVRKEPRYYALLIDADTAAEHSYPEDTSEREDET